MKARKYFKAALFTFILAASTAAFAGGKEKVELPYETKIGDTTLAAGSYTLLWDDAGKVEFLKGKKVVATAAATVRPVSNVRATAVSVAKAADGGRTLYEIEVVGKNVALSFDAPKSQLANGN